MELEYKGYKIVLLDNPRAIREEGDIMKHCVASYTTVVADGKYLVFSVQKMVFVQALLDIHDKIICG